MTAPTNHELDITGKVCPYCLLFVQKKIKNLRSGDVLTVTCDHPPAANENIPYAMKKAGHAISVEKLEPGLWKLVVTKK